MSDKKKKETTSSSKASKKKPPKKESKKKPTKKKTTKKASTKADKKEEGNKTTKALKKEFEEWSDSGVETAMLEWKKVALEDSMVHFAFGDGKDRFTLTFPEDYPNTEERFFVYSEQDSLGDWCNKMVEFCDKPGSGKPPIPLKDLLTEAAKVYLEVSPDSGDEGDDGSVGIDDDEEDLGLESVDKQKSAPPKKKEPDPDLDTSKFLDIGSPTATLRILKDLRSIQKANTKDMGFTAQPVLEKSKSKENLYHWEVRLFFEKDTALYKDLQASKKKSGQDYITLELRFSKDYPYVPPFLRVVRPRFKYMTGHVTLGGSICMELLTNSGWRSVNDIEGIIIQARAEMNEGGARLDLNNKAEYSEHEAWDAFYRAAGNHGWDVKGLGAEMFPKIT